MSNLSRRAGGIISLFARPDFVRFVVVGCLNTAITLVLFWLFVNVVRWEISLALAATWIAGVAINYSLNLVWSFRMARWPSFDKRFFRYALVYFLGYWLNVALLALFVNRLHLQAMTGQLLAMPFIVVFNYVGARFWALR